MAASEKAYLVGLFARTRAARERLALSQQGMAALLRIPKDTYKTYEGRSAMPLYLVEQFCGITHTDIHYFVTGRHRPALVIEKPVARPEISHKAKRA